MLLAVALNSLREDRSIVLTIVFAESNGLVDLSFSISDGLAHFKGDGLSCILKSLLNAISQFFDKRSSLLNSPLALDLESMLSTCELGI